jgi:hypothetical protein
MYAQEVGVSPVKRKQYQCYTTYLILIPRLLLMQAREEVQLQKIAVSQAILRLLCGWPVLQTILQLSNLHEQY